MNSCKVSRRKFIRTGTESLGTLALVAPGAPSDAAQPLATRVAEDQVRLAVVQQETLPGAVEKNRSKALGFAERALGSGADLILFHEELLVGYVENLKELAEAAEGPTSRAFQALLRGSGSLVLWGLTERMGEKCYIAATLVGAGGVVAHYRKTHLWWKDRGLRHDPTFYEPGQELVTFAVKGHKSGVMICYDGDFPEMTRAYANLGCSLLFWLNNRGSRGHAEVKPLAAANSMVIAAACCCGKNERGEPCRGGSNITGYDGSVLAEIWEREGVIYADVDPSAALSARKVNPWYVGRRSDLYCRYD